MCLISRERTQKGDHNNFFEGILGVKWSEACSGRENRGQKLNTNFFFLKLFGHPPGISRQNPGISRQKSLISLVSRDIPNFLAPHPFTWKTPTPPENIGLKSLGFCSFFVPEKRPFSELSESFGVFSEQLSEFRNWFSGMQNSILGMASHDLSNTKTTLVGATPGAILGIDGYPHERFSFATAFWERFF